MRLGLGQNDQEVVVGLTGPDEELQLFEIEDVTFSHEIGGEWIIWFHKNSQT